MEKQDPISGKKRTLKSEKKADIGRGGGGLWVAEKTEKKVKGRDFLFPPPGFFFFFSREREERERGACRRRLSFSPPCCFFLTEREREKKERGMQKRPLVFLSPSQKGQNKKFYTVV